MVSVCIYDPVKDKTYTIQKYKVHKYNKYKCMYVYKMRYFLKLLDKIHVKYGDKYVLYLCGFNSSGYDHKFVINAINKLKKCHEFECNQMQWQLFGGKVISGKIYKDNKCAYVLKDLKLFLDPGSLSMHLKKCKVPDSDGKCPLKLDVDVLLMNRYNMKGLYTEYGCIDTLGLIYLYKYTVIPNFIPLEDDKFLHCKYDVIQYVSQAQVAYNVLLFNIVDEDNYYIIPYELYIYGALAYFGARVDSEVYNCEYKGSINGIDITSMFPAALNNPIPCGEITCVDKIHITKLWEQKPFLGLVTMSKARQNRMNERYGLLPYMDQDTQRLYYLNSGTIRCVLTCVDIQNCINDGWVCKDMVATNCLQWDEWTDTVAAFYRKYFNVRNLYIKGTPLNALAKLLLNSSYGKCVQKAVDKKASKVSQIGWFCLSYTRRFHYDWKQKTILLKVPVILYGDTDSLFFDSDKVLEFMLSYYDANPTHINYDFVEQIKEFHEIYYKNNEDYVYNKHNQVTYNKILGDWNLTTFCNEFGFNKLANKCIVLGRKMVYMANNENKKIKHAFKGVRETTVKGVLQIDYNTFERVLQKVKVTNSLLELKQVYLKDRGTFNMLCSGFMIKKIRATVPLFCKQCNVCKLYSNATVMTVFGH